MFLRLLFMYKFSDGAGKDPIRTENSEIGSSWVRNTKYTATALSKQSCGSHKV
jgi:hypothetical protein